MSRVLAGLRHPVIAAPMGGGPSTPALAAAVSGAGGLGFLAGGYLSAGRLSEDIAATRALTDRPFGVNLFVPGTPAADRAAIERYARAIEPTAARLGASLGDPAWNDDGYPDKLRLLIDDPVPVASFAFGLPEPDAVRALRERGSEVWLTLTHPAAVDAAARLGPDAILVQGVEAGAHRGGLDDTDDMGLLPLLRLTRAGLVSAGIDTPLVAAGGIADGAGVAAALVAGASAVALGTAFLRCPEAGTSEVHRRALAGGGTGAGSGPADTALTRAFTGRYARGIRNGFIHEHDAEAPEGYPEVHRLTAPLRAAAREAGDGSAVNLWAGQAYPRSREVPAAVLVQSLASEAAEALEAGLARLRLSGS